MGVMQLRRGLMSAMGTNFSKYDFLSSYTVSGSWENDTAGNPSAIFSALGLDLSELNANQFYFCLFIGNTAPSYAVDCILYGKAANLGSFVLRNNKTEIRSSGESISAWVSSGTRIDIYKLTVL